MADTGIPSHDRPFPATSRHLSRQQQQTQQSRQQQEHERALPTDPQSERQRERRHALEKHETAETAGDEPAPAPPRASKALSDEPSHAKSHTRDNSIDTSDPGTPEAKSWVDSSHQDPAIALGGSASMDGTVKPLLFARNEYDRDSSADDDRVNAAVASQDDPHPVFPPAPESSFLLPGLAHPTASSVTEDYRSVIDDLTIENKRLKEELKRYRRSASRDVLEKEKLFEVKLHGLPRRKKQELEDTLRNFAASLGTTSVSGESKSTTRHKRKKPAPSKRKSTAGIYSLAGPGSKHASTSSSRSRPVDSAYASMSTGANSLGVALARPSFGGPQARTSEQKVERYLQDIPEGLHPNYGLGALSDKDKKKLIVRRLEQLFTGKIGGRYARRNRAMLPPADGAAAADEPGAPAVAVAHPYLHPYPIVVTSPPDIAHPMPASEPTREALIQSRQGGHKRYGSRDNLSLSNSNSNGDEPGNGNGNKSVSRSVGNGSGNGNGNGNGNENGNGLGSGNGNDRLTTDGSLPEQRPTRPRDLDPDRVQVPAENMEYIRHLGLLPSETGHTDESLAIDMVPDVDGWVYLNLLSNLAQLHIFHVAPDFIRRAIVEKSTKFQLSPDGQKIRWRGGIGGTKFSSDGSSGENCQYSQSVDEGEDSDKNGRRKKAKTSGDGSASAPPSSKKLSKSGPHASKRSSSFHYRPLFVCQVSSPIPSAEDADSQSSGEVYGSNPAITANISNNNASRSDRNSSGFSPRYRRRFSDGVLVYYTGAPFCTDLAGDSGGDTSPATFVTSSDQAQESAVSRGAESAPSSTPPYRATSSAGIQFRPLSDYSTLSEEELGTVGLSRDGSGCAIGWDGLSGGSAEDLTWLDTAETASGSVEPEPGEPFLEASGIGRVFPEDHFSLVVTTRRLVRIHENTVYDDDGNDEDAAHAGEEVFMSSPMQRLAAPKRQSGPISGAVPRQTRMKASGIGIHYVSTTMKHRDPAPLPPPVSFYPPFSPSSESGYDEDSTGSLDDDDEDESMLASSSEETVSRRANPHRSDNNPSPTSHALVTSGYGSDVEAERMEVDSKGDN